MTRHALGLLDTSVVIAHERREDATGLPHTPLISTITLAELSVGPLLTAVSEQAIRQARLQRLEADYDPIPFDANAARAFGRVAAELRSSGRKVSARTYEAMIAAIALANGLPLYTCDPRDFEGIEGLEVVTVTPSD